MTVAFAPLSARITAPLPSDDPAGMLITPDLSKLGRPDQLHVAFTAVEAFRAKHGLHVRGEGGGGRWGSKHGLQCTCEGGGGGTPCDAEEGAAAALPHSAREASALPHTHTPAAPRPPRGLGRRPVRRARQGVRREPQGRRGGPPGAPLPSPSLSRCCCPSAGCLYGPPPPHLPLNPPQVDEVDERIVRTVAELYQTELPALDAFFGGVVAQVRRS